MLDPRTELAVLFSVGVLALILELPMALLGLFALVLLSQLKMLARPKIILTMTVFVWGTAFSQAIFYDGFPKTALFNLMGLSFYSEGFAHGAVQSLRFLAVMLAGIGLVFRCSTAKIFSALLALRVPFYLALMGVTAARTVPQIASEIVVARRACAARGGPIWKRTPYAWAVLELRLLQTVVINSWRRSIHMSEALFARGFDAQAPRTELDQLRLKPLDWMVLGLLLTCVLGLSTVKCMFLLYRFDLYYNAQWRDVYAIARYWM